MLNLHAVNDEVDNTNILIRIIDKDIDVLALHKMIGAWKGDGVTAVVKQTDKDIKASLHTALEDTTIRGVYVE